MVNAKTELLEMLKGIKKDKKDIKCAYIEYCKINFEKRGDKDISIDKKESVLKINFTEEEYDNFLKEIDFNYDNGYGGQELFGFVWFNDGNWLERGEYEGSEWWEYKSCPQINQKCLRE